MCSLPCIHFILSAFAAEDRAVGALRRVARVGLDGLREEVPSPCPAFRAYEGQGFPKEYRDGTFAATPVIGGIREPYLHVRDPVAVDIGSKVGPVVLPVCGGVEVVRLVVGVVDVGASDGSLLTLGSLAGVFRRGS